MNSIPKALRNSLAALAILAGSGGGMYMANEATTQAAQNEYLQAVAADYEVSDSIKIAMVMAHYYESSNRHIGKPYIDRNGRGQPLTVCNGITGPEVRADKYYSPAECYEMEKRRYQAYERLAPLLLNYWNSYGPFQQATFLDFMHNKGSGALSSSTMRQKANAGDIAGACAENPRWNRGTVNGVSVVLPGLDSRARSNAELCTWEGQL